MEVNEVAHTLWDLQTLSFYGKNKILYLTGPMFVT